MKNLRRCRGFSDMCQNEVTSRCLKLIHNQHIKSLSRGFVQSGGSRFQKSGRQAADNGNNLPAKIIHFNIRNFFKYIIRSYLTVFFNFKQAVQFFSSILLNFYKCTLVSLSAFSGSRERCTAGWKTLRSGLRKQMYGPWYVSAAITIREKSNNGNRNGKTQNYFWKEASFHIDNKEK